MLLGPNELREELDGTNTALARAREHAYRVRRSAVRERAAKAIEAFYAAVERLAAEAHAALKAACVEGNRMRGRTEFSGLPWSKFDPVADLPRLRGGDALKER